MNYIIMPDLHGNYHKMIELLTKYMTIEDNKIISSDYKLILLGDFTDKGPLEEQMLIFDFLVKNRDLIISIRGNHEVKNYKVAKYYQDYINKGAPIDTDRFRTKHCPFPFFDNFLEKENLIEDYISYYDNYLLPVYQDENVICTHSPCLKEHIDNETSEMTKYVFPYPEDMEGDQSDYREFIEKFFLNLTNSNDYAGRKHFFGHLEVGSVLVNKDQIWLDTISKNLLTAAIIEDGELSFINKYGPETRIFHAPDSIQAKNYLFKTLLKNVVKMLVFIYGTLKKGFYNDFLMEGSSFIGECETTKKFPLNVKLNNYYPGLLNLPNEGHVISGELYEVSKTHFDNLIRFEGDEFQHGPIEISISEEKKIVETFFFIVDNSYKEENLSNKWSSERKALP